MSLSPKEIGDVVHKLTETFAVFRQKFDANQSKTWINALAEKPVALILRACDDHIKIGHYAPKPFEILSLIDGYRSRAAGFEKPQEAGQRTPEIAQAWITYLRFAHDFELPQNREVPDMPIQDALEIVNREAAKQNRPDAIKPEHRIDSYWGNAAA